MKQGGVHGSKVTFSTTVGSTSGMMTRLRGWERSERMIAVVKEERDIHILTIITYVLGPLVFASTCAPGGRPTSFRFVSFRFVSFSLRGPRF